jgi:hypothetical protein
MPDMNLLKDQSRAFRAKIADLLRSIPVEDHRRIPTGWKNHALWHAGHLLITPRLLCLGLSGLPLGVDTEWRALFAKDSSPLQWSPAAVLPEYDHAVNSLTSTIEEIAEIIAPRADVPFEQPYMTSAGVALRTPGEAFQFSFCHDGIHLGLILALRRSLAG